MNIAEFNLMYVNDCQVMIILDLDMNICFRCASEGKTKWWTTTASELPLKFYPTSWIHKWEWTLIANERKKEHNHFR